MSTPEREYGPNVRRLIVHKMSRDALPPGGGVADALGFLSDKGKMLAGARAAREWVRLALQAVRDAPGPNPLRDADDEAIAAELLRRVARASGGG